MHVGQTVDFESRIEKLPDIQLVEPINIATFLDADIAADALGAEVVVEVYNVIKLRGFQFVDEVGEIVVEKMEDVDVRIQRHNVLKLLFGDKMQLAIRVFRFD
jgi:hypothetical protein